MNCFLKGKRRTMLLQLLLALVLAPTSVVAATNKSDAAHAIREIERLGGQIKRDEKLPGRPVTAVTFKVRNDFRDEHVPLLTPFPMLTTLDLSYTKITDAGLRELHKLKNLTSFNLWSTGITDAGLKELTQLEKLTELNLGYTKVTDAGLKELIGLKNMTVLDVSDTDITDTGTKELVRFKNLTGLKLTQTKVTDASLPSLTKLKNLKTLNLRETYLTETGFAELRKTLPDARIYGAPRRRRVR
jgi:internalin A